MRAWMVMGAAMLVGVGVPGTGPGGAAAGLRRRTGRRPGGQGAGRDARGTWAAPSSNRSRRSASKGPFRREMGQRQTEGTVVLVLQGPDKMHRSEDTEFPGGMSIERITAVSGATSWEDTQNRGGMGGGMRMMMRGPGGAEIDEATREKMRTTRLTAEMQRWLFALLAAAVRRGHLCRRGRVARRQGRHARDEGRARPGAAPVRRSADPPAADARLQRGAAADDDAGRSRGAPWWRSGRSRRAWAGRRGCGGAGAGAAPARGSARARRRSAGASSRCRRRRPARSR